MPVIEIKQSSIEKRLGRTYTKDDFELLINGFGLELDEETSERKMAEKETGVVNTNLSSEKIYKIEVPANRYDLLSEEGLFRALRVYLEIIKTPNITINPNPSSIEVTHVTPNVASIRPFFVSAVLRNIKFTENSYKNFIALQEKLHTTLCRNRSLASVGTHDLDTVKGPFTYDAKPPSEIKFVALDQQHEMDAVQLFSLFKATDSHLAKYLHLIENKPLYPVLTDSNGIVLSLPPIINSNHTKITLNTRNVYIDITATDFTKANIMLNIIVSSFSEYCDTPYVVDPAKVILMGKESTYPILENRLVEVQVSYINKGIGIDIEPEKMVHYLDRMGLPTTLDESKKSLLVTVTPIRTDILHPCDLVEDIAIAYGYTKMVPRAPKTLSIGAELPINHLSDLLRGEVAMCGFTEILSFALLSEKENFEYLRKVDDGSAVKVAKPKTLEFQMARTSLLPGLLKNLKHNKEVNLPIKTFEISDVVLINSQSDVLASNERRLCAVYYGTTSGFELVHGLLNHVMRVLDVPWKEGNLHYKLVHTDDTLYLPGWGVNIIYCKGGKDIKAGCIGIIHPEVLANFGLNNVSTALELNLELFQ